MKWKTGSYQSTRSNALCDIIDDETTRDAQSHKHAPSQFSISNEIETIAARGVNKRLFLFRKYHIFLGVKLFSNFLIVHFGFRDYSHCSWSNNWLWTNKKKMVTKFLFLKKKFDGIHDRQHCKKLIYPFCVIEMAR